MIVIRRLMPGDETDLRAVRLRALADAPGNFLRTLAEEQSRPAVHWSDLLAAPATAMFGLFDCAAIIGLTAAYTDRDDPSGTTAGFGMTWLDPAYRRRGLSALFYAERIAWARSTGLHRIRVGHRASNIASGAAMRAAGFRPIGRRVHVWPDGVTEDEILHDLNLRG